MSCHPLFYTDFKKEITPGYSFLQYDPKSEAFHPGHDYNKNKGKGPNGDLNEPIHACKRGIARYARNTGGGYGNLTVLEHEDGTYSKYAHQNKILVVEGQMVEEGEVIGLTGKSGTSSIHCHHELLTAKLVEYLKKIRPTNWYTFYPDGKSVSWVNAYYINPLVAHTYPPPQAEIKKNMNILVCVNNSVKYDEIKLATRLKYDRDFWKNAFKGDLEMTVHYKNISATGMEWTEATDPKAVRQLTREYVSLNIIPYASGYDACIFWMSPDEWKSGGSLAYSVREQILGVHFIELGCGESDTDERFNMVPESSLFTGAVRHELSHMFYARTKSFTNVNNTQAYVPGDDNTHYFDFVAKDLAQVAKDIDLREFRGWIPKEGKRLFSYGGKPSNRRKDFSGNRWPGKVYRSTDSRMFFEDKSPVGTMTDQWKSITEIEFDTAIKAGKPYGIMSVEEANKIQVEIGLPLPPFNPKYIIDEVVTSGFREWWLKLNGWSEEIPTTHLKK